MNQCLLVQVLFTDGRTDKKTDRQRDRQTYKHGTDNNDTCSNQWYLPVGPTGPGEPGKPRGPGVIQSLLGSQWSQHDTEPAGTAVPGSTRGPGTPGGPGKPGMPVAPVAPASPSSPGEAFGPENSFILSVFHFYNSKIGITSYGALGHCPMELVRTHQFVNFQFSSLCRNIRDFCLISRTYTSRFPDTKPWRCQWIAATLASPAMEHWGTSPPGPAATQQFGNFQFSSLNLCRNFCDFCLISRTYTSRFPDSKPWRCQWIAEQYYRQNTKVGISWNTCIICYVNG